MNQFALIACCGLKLDHPAPARHLYTSPLFRKSVAWAERGGLGWAVLSAKFGLVHSYETLPPYNLTLSGMTTSQRAEWVDRVRRRIATELPGLEFVVLAGRLYRSAVAGLPHTVPMAGLGIGQQLRWLTEAAA